jgi:spermidine/putrescine-binding protein
MGTEGEKDVVARSMTRDELLRRGAGLAALGLVPAILGGRAMPAYGAPSGTDAVGGTLNYFGFQGRDLQACAEVVGWQNSHGVKFVTGYQTSPFDTIAKLKANGGQGIDLLNGSGSDMPAFLDAGGVLRSLDKSKLPNLKYLNPFFTKKGVHPWTDRRGQFVGIPLFFYAFGIAYDKSKMAKPTTFLDLLKPELKGKVAFTDNPLLYFGLGGRALGIDYGKMSPALLDTVTNKFVRPLIGQARTVSRSAGDTINLLASGEVSAIIGANPSTALSAIKAGNPNARYTADFKTGSMTVIMTYSIPPKAANADTAYAWINALLDPKLNAAASNVISFGTTITGAEKYLTPSNRAKYPYGNLSAYLDKNPLAINPPIVTTSKYVGQDKLQTLWATLKAGS